MCGFFAKLKEAREEKRRRNRKTPFFFVQEKQEEMNVIRIVREEYSDLTTIGSLLLPNGSKFCHTLEDTARRHKLQAKTAIPSGRYEIKLQRSPKFRRFMPYLMDVPYYEGIVIHWGNVERDTEGCILVGYGPVNKDFIGNSRAAFDALYSKLSAMQVDGKIFVDITGGFKAEDWAEADGTQKAV